MAEPAIQVEWLGNERNPVVVIDDLAPSYETLRAASMHLDFVPFHDQYYPGTRAIAPPAYFETVGETITSALREFFGCKKVRLQQAYYSLVTTPRDALSLAQRLPHYDTLFENYYAVVHFLCSEEFGGTAFFRHRATGFESICSVRHASYSARLDLEIDEFGAPEPGYIAGDTHIFDHLATVDAFENRAVVFRGNSLHSGWISNARFLPDDPLEGRLTVVSFLIAD